MVNHQGKLDLDRLKGTLNFDYLAVDKVFRLCLDNHDHFC